MGIDPPYLYSAPTRYSAIQPYNEFDPKAISRASLVYSPPKPRPRQEGPLLDFNRHPDSYLIVPYGQTDAKPMAPQTKRRMIFTRRAQLALRLLGLISAILMMIAVICIKGMQDLEGWALRVTPAVDIAFSLYGVYHLIRPAKDRTPASSASYHFFAMIMDGGLIPFYVFAVILGKSQYNGVAGAAGWTSFFTDESTTKKIILGSWILGTNNASMHLITLIMSMYLVYMFRKIARLPPDMNPLEDNLTSRHASKHKHKNSSILENNMRESYPGTASVADPSRHSQADSLLSQSRRVPFFLTRNETNVSLSLHNSPSVAASRTDLPSQIYQHPRSNRVSVTDLQRNSGHSDVGSQHGSISFLSVPPQIPRKSSKRHSTESRAAQSSASRYSFLGEATYEKQALVDDNWFVYGPNDENADPRHAERGGLPVHAITCDTPSPPPRQRPCRVDLSEGFVPEPLGMNPPTPGLPSDQWLARSNTTNTNISALSSTSANKGTPKGRYYGDLKAATRGVRGGQWGEERERDRDSRALSRSGVDITDSSQAYANVEERQSAGGKGLEEEGRVGPARYRKLVALSSSDGPVRVLDRQNHSWMVEKVYSAHCTA